MTALAPDILGPCVMPVSIEISFTLSTSILLYISLFFCLSLAVCLSCCLSLAVCLSRCLPLSLSASLAVCPSRCLPHLTSPNLTSPHLTSPHLTLILCLPTALNPISCAAYGIQNPGIKRAEIYIDIDGSGPLVPFPVACEFYSKS